MKMSYVVLVFALVISLANCQSSPTKNSTEDLRKPASTSDLFQGADQVVRDLHDNSIFNAQTCPAYLTKVTQYLFGASSDYFVPKTPAEAALFKEQGLRLLNTLFQVQVTLRERFQEFDEKNELSHECLNMVRDGIQYARYTQEYLLEWLVHNKVVPEREPNILQKDPIYTLTNPKFENFKLQTGDLMVIRGQSFVSAMIARIADEEGNFSHLAIIGEDKAGHQYVVEALIQTGVIITPLQKWLQTPDARVALFRQRDPQLAQKAGRTIYDYAKARLSKDGEIRYDFAMNDFDYSKFFCSEVAKYAYDKASDGKLLLPKYRSGITKFKNSDYPESLGVTSKTLFAPYDIEADPRFDFIAEYKYYPLLRQVRMQDAVLQSVYDWMIEKNYTFHWTAKMSTKAYLGKFLRQFGLLKDKMPKYMPIRTIATTLQFEGVATVLEQNIYKKEDEYYKKNGYLPTFKALMDINEAFRKEDCLTNQAFMDKVDDESSPSMPYPQFHWFFSPDKNASCN